MSVYHILQVLACLLVILSVVQSEAKAFLVSAESSLSHGDLSHSETVQSTVETGEEASQPKQINQYIDSVLSYINLSNFNSSSALGSLITAQSKHAQVISSVKHYLSTTPNPEQGKRKTWLTTLNEDWKIVKMSVEDNLREKLTNILPESASKHTCEKLPAEYTPYLFCSGVVDYEFFVAPGMTSNDLDVMARTYGSYFTTYLNTRCLTNVKKLLCASIYLPCAANAVPGDISTYPTVNNATLPYVRPCRSVCTATTYLDSSCGGMLEAMGLGSNCDSVDMYSGLPLYVDDSNPNAVCNSLPHTQGISLVAEQKEPYIGEVCSGIAYEYSVPPPSAIDPNFAPLLPPFVLQVVTETILASFAKLIPRYLVADCLIAQRALVCSSYFLKPYPSEALAMIFGTIYLPSFPDRRVCEKYENKCSTLIDLVPALAVDCEGRTATGIYLYPNETNLIASVDLGFGAIPLTSEPNTLSDMTFTITSQCPYGFDFPDDPSNPGSVVAAGTACAASCPLAIYTPTEYSKLYYETTVMIWFSLGMASLQLVNVIVMKPARRNIFLVLSIVATIIYLSVQALQLLAVPQSADLVCDNPTTWHSFESFGQSTAGSFCVATSFIGPWVLFFSWWILLALSGEIWLRVAWGIKKVEPYRKYYMLLPGVVLFTQALFVQFYDNSDVMIPASFSLFCAWGTADPDMKYYTVALPGTLYLCIALGMVVHSIYICVMTSLKVKDADNKPLKKIWKSYSMLFLFMALEIVIYPVSIFLFYTKWYYVDADYYITGSIDWIACLFTHFTTSSDTTYLDICGTVPAVRISVDSMLTAFLFSAYLTSIVIFMITLNKEVKEFWWNFFIAIITFSGIKGGLNLLHIPIMGYLSMAKYTSQSANPSVAESDLSVSMSCKVKQSLDSRRNSYLLNFSRLKNQLKSGGGLRRSRENKVAVMDEQKAILEMIDQAEGALDGTVCQPPTSQLIAKPLKIAGGDGVLLTKDKLNGIQRSESLSTLKAEDDDEDTSLRTRESGEVGGGKVELYSSNV